MTAQPAPQTAPARSEIAIVIEDPAWHDMGIDALAERACGAALAWLGLAGSDVAILACDDTRIRQLNTDFRDRPAATNVLSWPAAAFPPRPDGAPPPPARAGFLGDIAIAFPTCRNEAMAQGKHLADHATHLLVHAVLHLAGYDHEREADAALMEDAERAILRMLGVADPYADEAPPTPAPPADQASPAS